MNNLQLIETILIYIENHLSDEITFEILADEFGYSSFHFHKIFTSVTGQTITDYLKKRRLLKAYVNVTHTEMTITNICYDCGFKSIQTFNRSFKDTFHMIPSEARKRKLNIDCKSIQTIISSYEKRIHFKGEYIMEPKFVQKEDFILVGSRKHTKNGWHVIGESWEELKSYMNKLNRTNSNVMFGFEDYSEDFTPDPLSFYYMAAVEVNDTLDVPEGLFVKKIPKSLYAVFTVNGNNANGEIGKAFRYIYDTWLPNSQYYLSDELCADFEYYDERWDCQSANAQIDLYIPVKCMNND